MGRRSVLLVEDEPLIAYEIESLLTDEGFTIVGMASTLEDALRIAVDTDAGAALLDVNIEGRSIAPVTDILKRRGIPFALVTGYGRADLPPEMGDATLVSKPIAGEDLLRIVRRLVGD